MYIYYKTWENINKLLPFLRGNISPYMMRTMNNRGKDEGMPL